MTDLALLDAAALSFDEATELTESIRASVADIEQKVVRAFFGRVWVAMDYESWDEYVQGEFKSAPLALPREDRRVQVASLRQQGLSLRAIASATGVDHKTVKNDLDSGGEFSPPGRTIGADGKDYPASQPNRPTPSQEARDTASVQKEPCPYCGQDLPADLRKEG